MAREMLKLRKGDSAIMIKTDGSVELAGVNDKPIMSAEGMISPVILFAAAWAKKDDSLLKHLVDNFKNCVREGYFGPEAQSDYKAMEIEAEKNRIRQEEGASGAVTMPEGTVSQEDFDKHKAEEDRLEAIAAQGQDERQLRQMEAMKAGATVVETKEFDGHKLPETEDMLNVRDGQTVGNVTIEEGADNEDK
tara:strand:+ start:321 stop:896 length:576 start_codon:yes stop_codon:yes gene_type:complete